MTFTVHNVGCVGGGEAFLLLTDSRAAMVDTGFSFTAKEMLGKVSGILGERKLDYILLTHSHYDHVSGASVLKRRWPDAEIIAAEHAAKVFERPNAIKKMRKLNRAAARSFGKSQLFRNDMKLLHAQRAVHEGDIIDMGEMRLTVLETPGHTWDTIAFWCPEERFLISNETMGVYASKTEMASECLVSCRKALDFIHRARELAPDKMLMAHYGMVYGDICRQTIDMAERDTTKLKDLIVKGHSEGMDVEQLKQLVKDTIWVGPMREGQPEAAFDLNNKYIVPVIVKEYCSDQ